MKNVRNIIGGLGNLLFKEAFIYSMMRDEKIPDLYLQDERYFVKYADEIKQRFGDGIGFTNYIGIHVRRGDFVGSDFHTELDTDYYKNAMSFFPDKTFIVFSDDIEWCKNQSVFKDCAFSEGNDEIEDFNMLASCAGLIIANSTFSWWAAYLCPNPNKRIVAPKEDTWFTDKVIRIKLPDKYEQI